MVSAYVERRATSRNAHRYDALAAAAFGELIPGSAWADPANGTVLLFQGDSPEIAEAFAIAGPYVTNGLVTPWEYLPEQPSQVMARAGELTALAPRTIGACGPDVVATWSCLALASSPVPFCHRAETGISS